MTKRLRERAVLARELARLRSMTSWIDSHAHLTMVEADALDQTMARATDAGVEGVLVPATGPDDLDRTIRVAERFPARVVAAAGVHPHEASSLDATQG